MNIVITELSPEDHFYDISDRVIGLVGEADESRTHDWGDGYSEVYMVPNRLSCEMQGIFRWKEWPDNEVCLFKAKYITLQGD